MRLRCFSGKLAILVLMTAAVPVFTFAQQPRKESLLNGLKVLMFPNSGADKVWVRIRVHSGSAFDPQGKEGTMQLLAANFFPTEAAREYFKDELGGSLEITANYDYIEVDASAKPDSLIPMLETLSTDVANTVVDKDTTVKVKADLLAKVKQLESDPNYIADRAAAHRLFGSFPYGRPMYGTEESLKKTDWTDVLDAKNRFLTADNATMAISGNFQTQRALQAIKRFFGGWMKADKKIPATFRQPDDPDTKELKIDSPGLDGVYRRWARRAPARVDADYAAAKIFASIISEWRCRTSSRFESLLLAGIWFDGTVTKSDSPAVYSGPCPVVGLNVGPQSYADFITESDVSGAKALLSSKASEQGGLERRWLDVDTYALASADEDAKRMNSVTLQDVRNFVKKLDASPKTAVTVASAH
ncbi:MAG: insulinase family protein [Acidobacteria bacterium]|nr:insulinase family protein [Acidobacteriota bacterium]